MKKLIFIGIAILLMAAALPVATGWLNYSGAKNYAMWTTRWLQADQVFYWQGDTIKKDSLIYTDLKTDSARFRYIDGTLSPWYYAGKGAYTLPTASATVKGGIKVGSGLSINAGVLSASGGSGTVTTFSTGNLSPLFTASVSNPTTTPALSFTLSTQAAEKVFAGPEAGANAAPTFRYLTENDIPTLHTSKLDILGTRDGTKFLRDDDTWSTIPANSGTVTSVGLSAPSGFSVSGSPVISSGTLALSFASGYSLPTTAKQTNWDAAYGWGNHASAGYQLKPSTGALYYGTSSGWILTDPYFLFGANYVTYVYASGYSRTLEAATAGPTGQAGVMTNADKTNLDGLVTDKGKVQTSGGTLAYLNDSYFTLLGGWKPTTESTPTYLSDKPFSSGGAYTQLGLKADLSGAAFTGAISGTSASFSGNVTANNLIGTSDRRLKKDIKPLQNIDWVDKIYFVSYKMKSDSLHKNRYGVIAQDVEKVAPDLVITNEKGLKAVSYIDLLILKNQRLQNQIKSLKYETVILNSFTCLLLFITIFVRSKRS